MEKLVKIGNDTVPMKTNGLILLIYKREFGRELIADLFSIYKKDSKKEKEFDAGVIDLESIDFEAAYNIAYVFAKTADPTIRNRDEWLASFDTFPIVDVLEEIIPLATECITTDANVKKQIAAASLRQTMKPSKRKKSFLPQLRRG